MSANMNAERKPKPVRDSKGRFIKGHKPFIRPKYELMRKYPMLICATCYKGKECPAYHPENVCLFRREFKKLRTRNINEVTQKLWLALNKNYADMQFAFIQETISGECSKKATRLVSRTVNRAVLLYQIEVQIKNSKSSVCL